MGITTSEGFKKKLLSPPPKIDMNTEYAPYGEKEAAMSKEMNEIVVSKQCGSFY